MGKIIVLALLVPAFLYCLKGAYKELKAKSNPLGEGVLLVFLFLFVYMTASIIYRGFYLGEVLRFV